MTNVFRFKAKEGERDILHREGYQMVDMHVHTSLSDGITSVRRLISRAKKLGIGLGISDHNEIRGAEIAYRMNEVFVLPGIEVTCREGMHLLVYFPTLQHAKRFFDNHLLLNRTRQSSSFTNIGFIEVMDRAPQYFGFVVAAHPYCAGWTGIMKRKHRQLVTREWLDKFDAIEVCNGSNLQKWNAKSTDLAIALNKPMTGGSDAHTPHEVGSVLTCAKAATPAEFLAEVQKKNNMVLGSETNLAYQAGVQLIKYKSFFSMAVYGKRTVKSAVRKLKVVAKKV
jgi:hypothetical protein